jgi:hypothetical protein
MKRLILIGIGSFAFGFLAMVSLIRLCSASALPQVQPAQPVQLTGSVDFQPNHVQLQPAEGIK